MNCGWVFYKLAPGRYNSPLVKNKIYYIKEFDAPGAQQLFQGQIETLFDKNRFLSVQYPQGTLSKLLFLLKFFFKVRKSDILFFIHPLYSKTNRLILNLSLFKKCNVVCIVSDINSLRNIEMKRFQLIFNFLIYCLLYQKQIEKILMKLYLPETL